ncbi:MAG: 3-phosphoserine/phosphohydroxythreonine transaminase, partial [Burkholderiales bacterium]
SHRGKEFTSIYVEAESLLRELLNVPANYKVLFLQGGAIGQNAIVPMNLLRGKTSIDFVNTGDWSKRSIAEAQKYCAVNIAATAEAGNFTSIPKQGTWKLDPNAAYVHICSNETIGGIEYHWTPDTGPVPLVADMSSNILSRPVDVNRYGLIYCGAQKNIGQSGLTIVIVREDLIGNALPITPSAFDYKLQADNDSMVNTPPTYAIYIAGLVFKWIKEQGGLASMETHNRSKAALLYDYLDSTSYYSSPVAREDRSLMNVPFKLRDATLDEAFLKGAQARNLLQLKGHRLSGGMRASIYNAMPIEGVKALVEYMKEFENSHG